MPCSRLLPARAALPANPSPHCCPAAGARVCWLWSWLLAQPCGIAAFLQWDVGVGRWDLGGLTGKASVSINYTLSSEMLVTAEPQCVKTQLLSPSSMGELSQGWDFPLEALMPSRALTMNTATHLLSRHLKSPGRMHGLSPDGVAVPAAQSAPQDLLQQDLLLNHPYSAGFPKGFLLPSLTPSTWLSAERAHSRPQHRGRTKILWTQPAPTALTPNFSLQTPAMF